MSKETILKQFGLKEKEVKVYLAVLKMGAQPVRAIARETGVNRGTTYDILRKLMKKHLVSYFEKDKHQYFVAESPEELKEIVKYRQEKLQNLKTSIDSLIPELKSIYDNAGEKFLVKYYEGLSGIKFILKDVLKNTSKEYLVYSAETIRPVLVKAYKSFTQDRVKRNVRVRVLALGSGGKLCGLDKRKWVSRKKVAPTYILIYADRTAMISVDRSRQPVGVIIHDQSLADTQRLLFEQIWQSL